MGRSNFQGAWGDFPPRVERAIRADRGGRRPEARPQTITGRTPMIDRRKFTTLLAGSVAAPILPSGTSSAQAAAGTVFYSSVGGELTLYSMDVDNAALTKQGTVTVPANIQYAWRHPTKAFFYVVSSGGGPGAGACRQIPFARRLPEPPGKGARSPGRGSRRFCRHGRSTPRSTWRANSSSPPITTRARSPFTASTPTAPSASA